MFERIWARMMRAAQLDVTLYNAVSYTHLTLPTN